MIRRTLFWNWVAVVLAATQLSKGWSKITDTDQLAWFQLPVRPAAAAKTSRVGHAWLVFDNQTERVHQVRLRWGDQTTPLRTVPPGEAFEVMVPGGPRDSLALEVMLP